MVHQGAGCPELDGGHAFHALWNAVPIRWGSYPEVVVNDAPSCVSAWVRGGAVPPEEVVASLVEEHGEDGAIQTGLGLVLLCHSKEPVAAALAKLSEVSFCEAPGGDVSVVP